MIDGVEVTSNISGDTIHNGLSDGVSDGTEDGVL